MKIKINLQRKHKYALLSLTVSMLLFLFSYDAFNLRVFWAIFVVLTGVFGSIWVQYTSVITSKQYFFKQTLLNVLVLPVILVVGALLSLIYFPNLGLPTRIITLLSVGGVMYVVSLVNNIFLVVFEKNEVIPLYRVAVTWSQILIVVISIPFFAGIFKLPINSIYQSLLVAIPSGIFAQYLLWFWQMDGELPPISRGEGLLNSLLVSFIVFSLSLSVSFVPTESFLRSLLVAATLMYSLGYLGAHYKNQITKKLIAEYTIIIAIFLILVLIFK